MGQQTPISETFELPDGREVTIETGKLANQADGAVMIKMGDTMLFASAVSEDERKDLPFFPMYVDYQEKFASAGRIPGNFFRREAKLNDYEILTSRLVDRALRPLFPDDYNNDTQILINLHSADDDVMPDALAALAASSALSVSDIPWDGPISEVRVAKIEDKYVINPGREALEEAELELIVAATLDHVMMVEGEADECSEHELIEAIRTAHEAIKVQCQAQLNLAQKVGDKALVKKDYEQPEGDEDLKTSVEKQCEDRIEKVAKASLDKEARSEQFDEIIDEFIEGLENEFEDGEELEEKAELAKSYYDDLKKEVIRRVVLKEKTRLDGRKYDEIRPIWCEVDYLPATHGSAIFNRGETQSLTSMTLGNKKDEMMVDHALDFHFDDFILHYNFPAFSVGEIKPLRAPARREVGHANLAGRSIRKVMPDLPYTVRIVSDIMESNGSSSMATVCAASLALMDGGIQLSSPVSGIAMGMIKEGDDYAILSDILGDEDRIGDMDFKIAGTRNGITSCQMDIKISGLPYEMMEKALEQAREGRLHILDKMQEVIAEPREDLKPHAPRIKEIVIDKEFIGDVIGPGGKIIQEMQEETGTVINVEEVDKKGIVQISANDKESIEAAAERINTITHVPEVGNVYEGEVEKVMPYGVFVAFKNKSGLLHISEISHTHIKNVEDVLNEGDSVKVKLIGIDRKAGKFRLSRKALMPKDPHKKHFKGGNNDGDNNDD